MLKQCTLSFWLLSSLPLFATEMERYQDYQVSWLKNEDIPQAPKHLLEPKQTEDGKRYQIIVICGTKGAGKTSTIHKMITLLKEQGHYVDLFAPFLEVNRIYDQHNGSFGMFTNSSRTAIEVEEKLYKLISTTITKFLHDLKEAPQSTGVLLFDRGWLTVLASLDDAHKDLPSTTRHQLWQEHWLSHVYPTIFIEAEPEITKSRRQGQLDVKSGLPTSQSIIKDYFRRKNLCAQFQDWVIDHFDTSLAQGDEIGVMIDKKSHELTEKITKHFTS